MFPSDYFGSPYFGSDFFPDEDLLNVPCLSGSSISVKVSECTDVVAELLTQRALLLATIDSLNSVTDLNEVTPGTTEVEFGSCVDVTTDLSAARAALLKKFNKLLGTLPINKKC